MFRKNHLLLFVIVLSAAAVALLLACASPIEQVATPTGGGEATKVVLPTATPLGAEVKPVPGGIIRRSVSADPPTWDPNKSTGSETHGPLNFVHAFLVDYHYGAQYPRWYFEFSNDGLAKSWEISPDGLTYTFHLREGVKFQNKPPLNGRELVASDAKWSIQNIIDTPGSPRGQQLTSIVSMETPDKYTLIIHLKEPRIGLLHLLANPYIEIVAPELKQKGDLNSQAAVVGAGPFMLKEYVPNTRLVFEKNPTYYRANEGLPYLDEVYTLIIADTSTGLAAFRAERLDIRSISRLDLASVKQTNPNIYCEENEISATQMALHMNTSKPPFNDVRVRRAVSMAFDRQTFINTLYLGYGIEQNGPINAASPWYLQDQGKCMKYYKYNPEEAKRLLAEAGYPNGFETTLYTCTSWGSTFLEYAEYWVDALSKIGIKATMKPQELGAHYITRVGKYEGLCYTYDWGGATVEPDNWLPSINMTGGPSNYSAISDPEMDRVITAQMTALTPEKRQEYLNDIQRYFACQQFQVQMPMAYTVTCYQPWVRNLRVHAADMSTGRYYQVAWVTEQSPTHKK